MNNAFRAHTALVFSPLRGKSHVGQKGVQLMLWISLMLSYYR